jgi:hypothetical protein
MGKVEKRQMADSNGAGLLAKLKAYASAAGAAASLGIPIPAAAKIVYTPANVLFEYDGTYAILPDGVHGAFTLSDRASYPLGFLRAYGLSGGEIVASQNAAYTPVLPASQTIGHKLNFGTHATLVWGVKNSESLEAQFVGPWQNTKNGFLGFKFLINGETHYGWARITTHQYCCNENPFIAAALTGFAYETIPNRHILAGQTVGADDEQATDAESAALGFLALGAAGLPPRKKWPQGLNSNA